MLTTSTVLAFCFFSSASASVFSALGLDVLAKHRGKYIGTATEAYNINNDTTFGHAYGKLAVSNEFGFYTNENNLKWETTEKEPGVFDFTEAEKLFAIAKKHGKQLRGHTLVWHSQLPSWVNAGNFTADELRAVLKRHIQTQGRVYAWDVVNEAFNDDGSLRQTVFYQTLGEDYLELAFRLAHAADPKAKLYYNDYNLETISPKTDAVYELFKNLKAKGVPIHGIGAQAHLEVGNVQPDIKEALHRFTTIPGVEVALTELDIRGLVPATAEKLAQQEQDFYTVIKACVDIKKCVGVTVWQFSDALSWVPGVFTTEGYALPWDEDLKKKPAYQGIKKALLS
ncbi:family 10 glycosyl hydrolase [Auriculariales sp. MPI-PUGE-AT-0066]|nr:family 10 glycosyl hydrolase [Auriculariales sp. MPI-PUGE-AT-0066]